MKLIDMINTSRKIEERIKHGQPEKKKRKVKKPAAEVKNIESKKHSEKV